MLKKWKFISPIILFLISFPIHFLYTLFPNIITSFFTPVNESIFEHMKLFITSLSIVTIFDYFILNKKNITFNNIFLNLFLTIVFSIITYLIIYIPIYNTFGENIIFSIILLFIILVISQIISYFIYNIKELELLNYVSILLVISICVIFTYLSYNPIYNYIFFDTINEKYGIDKYID